MSDPSVPKSISVLSYTARFGGIERLLGADGVRRIRSAHVCVVGLGGVGSWAVEALARSGLGALTLVDLDDVCISNVNRQLPAMTGTFGQPKAEVLAERIRAIQPQCQIAVRLAFFTAATASDILSPAFDFVFDAIDQPKEKAQLAAACWERRLPLIVSGGAGGRRDPTAVRLSPLPEVTHDRLLAELRRRLRKEHGLDSAAQSKFMAVHSPEPLVYPAPDGGVCLDRREAASLRLDCRTGFGTAAFVTGAFGFAAASFIVRQLAHVVPRPDS